MEGGVGAEWLLIHEGRVGVALENPFLAASWRGGGSVLIRAASGLRSSSPCARLEAGVSVGTVPAYAPQSLTQTETRLTRSFARSHAHTKFSCESKQPTLLCLPNTTSMVQEFCSEPSKHVQSESIDGAASASRVQTLASGTCFVLIFFLLHKH